MPSDRQQPSSRRQRRIQMCVLRINSCVMLAFGIAMLVLAAVNTIKTTKTTELCKLVDMGKLSGGKGGAVISNVLMSRLYLRKYNISSCMCKPPTARTMKPYLRSWDVSRCDAHTLSCSVACAEGYTVVPGAPEGVLYRCTFGRGDWVQVGEQALQCVADRNTTAAPTPPPTPLVSSAGAVSVTDRDAVSDGDDGDGASFVSTPSRVLIGMSLLIMLCALLGLCANPDTKRATLFIHHFMLLLLFVSVVYLAFYFAIWARSSDEIMDFYWPFIKDSFDGASKAEAQDAVHDWLQTASWLSVSVLVSLLCGIVASGRMLGLRLLAKNLLILSNITTLFFGLVGSVVTISFAASGYSDPTIVAICVLGITTVLLGVVGLCGAFLERVHMLNVHFVCMALTATMQSIIAANCIIIGLSGTIPRFLYERYNELRVQWGAGVVSDADAMSIVHTHMLLLGLMAVLMAILMILNLIASRVLVRSIAVEGRYAYEPVSLEDDDERELLDGDGEWDSQRSPRDRGKGSAEDLQFELEDLERAAREAKRT